MGWMMGSDATPKEAAKRQAISKKLRFDVFKRDGFVCQYCGAHPPQVVLEVDHIHPVAEGGTNDVDNLVTACFHCNRGKGAGLLCDVPQTLEQRAAVAAEREAQIAGYEEVMRAKRLRLESDAESVMDIFCLRFRQDSIPQRDFDSMKMFVDKLGLHEVIEAAEIACGRKYDYRPAFKYFCGVCWNKVRQSEGA